MTNTMPTLGAVYVHGFRRFHHHSHDTDQLPDRLADLTHEQIANLFYQPPKIRWKYTQYFTGQGRVREEFYDLIFEKLPTGELRHSRATLRCNVQNWEAKLRYFEHPGEFNADGTRRTKCPSLFRNRRADDGAFRSRCLDEVPELSRASRAIVAEVAERGRGQLIETVAELREQMKETYSRHVPAAQVQESVSQDDQPSNSQKTPSPWECTH